MEVKVSMTVLLALEGRLFLSDACSMRLVLKLQPYNPNA